MSEYSFMDGPHKRWKSSTTGVNTDNVCGMSDLISRSELKKEVEHLVAGGADRLKDYYENGSKREENEWIGGVYDVWELIDNAPIAEAYSFEQV